MIKQVLSIRISFRQYSIYQIFVGGGFRPDGVQDDEVDNWKDVNLRHIFEAYFSFEMIYYFPRGEHHYVLLIRENATFIKWSTKMEYEKALEPLLGPNSFGPMTQPLGSEQLIS